jgi:hypothetical protein
MHVKLLLTLLWKNIKQAKGNECSQNKRAAAMFSFQSAHLPGLFSPCHAYPRFESMLCTL